MNSFLPQWGLNSIKNCALSMFLTIRLSMAVSFREKDVVKRCNGNEKIYNKDFINFFPNNNNNSIIIQKQKLISVLPEFKCV